MLYPHASINYDIKYHKPFNLKSRRKALVTVQHLHDPHIRLNNRFSSVAKPNAAPCILDPLQNRRAAALRGHCRLPFLTSKLLT